MAVEPEPRPSFMPLFTILSTAVLPAISFINLFESCSMRLLPFYLFAINAVEVSLLPYKWHIEDKLDE
jgi:hypothetical protein